MNYPYPSETGCCTRFDAALWDDREHHWSGKTFLRYRVRCFLYIPLSFGTAMQRCLLDLKRGEAFTPAPPLVLSDHTSRWNMDVHVECTQEVPGADNVRLTGTFHSKVFRGPYRDACKWAIAMKDWAAARNLTIKRHLLHYAYCPKCAKHYGENPVAYFVEV
ncbi:MAG TPA: hydrolase [Opitutaceae bacterium]|nr:hydrolase [Opitutaceae bacterium]